MKIHISKLVDIYLIRSLDSRPSKLQPISKKEKEKKNRSLAKSTATYFWTSDVRINVC